MEIEEFIAMWVGVRVLDESTETRYSGRICHCVGQVRVFDESMEARYSGRVCYHMGWGGSLKGNHGEANFVNKAGVCEG